MSFGSPKTAATRRVDLEDVADRHLGLAPRKLLSSGGGDPYMMVRPAPRAMQALATQIATCPMQGPSRSLYLGGKALELTALNTPPTRIGFHAISAPTSAASGWIAWKAR